MERKMSMKKVLVLSAFLVAGIFHTSWGQADNPPTKGKYKLPAEVVGQDTLPVYVMQDADVNIQPQLTPEMLQKQKEWQRLVRCIRVVMPYANIAAMKMKEIDDSMAKMDRRRDKKKYLHEQEDQLKAEFKSQLENLSVYQGKLLVKLLDRQTGHTSYALIKEYKSGFQAFMWQAMAGTFGMDLKEHYDPAKEPLMEAAIKAAGYN
jgi:hypothetical protein